jgi:hypothetical protein
MPQQARLAQVLVDMVEELNIRRDSIAAAHMALVCMNNDNHGYRAVMLFSRRFVSIGYLVCN